MLIAKDRMVLVFTWRKERKGAWYLFGSMREPFFFCVITPVFRMGFSWWKWSPKVTIYKSEWRDR